MAEEHTEINRELLEINRRLIANSERYAAALAEIIWMLAKDTLAITDLAVPSDELEMIIIRGVRQRAEKILAGFGGGHQTH